MDTIPMYTPGKSPEIKLIEKNDEFLGWKVTGFCAEIPELCYLIHQNDGSWQYSPDKDGDPDTQTLADLATYATQNWMISQEVMQFSPSERGRAEELINISVSLNRAKNPSMGGRHCVEVFVSGIDAQAANWTAIRLHSVSMYNTVTIEEHPDGGWWYECLIETPLGIDAKNKVIAQLAPYWLAQYQLQAELEE